MAPAFPLAAAANGTLVPHAQLAPSNATHRQLHQMHHEFHKAGTFCMGNKLAPLVLLMGCQRCGTNSLYEDLMDHVHGARRGHPLKGEPEHYGREQHFYATDTWSRGTSHYLEHFPACPAKSSSFQFVIDATPAYMRKPIVADRIPEVLPSGAVPKLKMLFLLRDPTRRLYAYWDTFVLAGTGVNNFDAWVEATMKKVAACQKKNGDQLWPPPEDCDTDTVEGVAAGLYAYQLIYYSHRFDAKQFFVTTLNAYEANPTGVLHDVAKFVGASGTLAGSKRSAGETFSVKVHGAMSDWARKDLGRFYREHNAQLIHFFNNQPRFTYSPSLKGMGVQDWD